jgi:hypothetical protein
MEEEAVEDPVSMGQERWRKKGGSQCEHGAREDGVSL